MLHIFICGGWEIRTPEGIAPLPPFQDGALDRYANPPICLLHITQCGNALCCWRVGHEKLGNTL